ncbi:MAG: P-loop NTPase fold protein [Verrucomicrobiota bacterium]
MTTNDESHPFDPDQALSDPKDDQLKRDEFSKELAEHIGSWKGNESIVIGINGAWGTGKSTVKNFIKHYLSQRTPDPTIVEFNPWEWSGQQKLLEGFLSEIGIALGRVDKAGEYKELAKKWKRFADYLQFPATLAEAVSNISKGVFGASLIASAAALSTSSTTGSAPFAVGIILTVVSAALAFFPAAANAAVTLFDKKAAAHDKSIEEVKDELSKALTTLKAPVVIFLDDVDRLTDKEVKILFQLVKANCQFPNLIYVILFEREVVEEALSKIVSGGGRRYLRKIVQHSFDLPHPSPSRLRRIIGEDLDSALSMGGTMKVHWNADRWRDGLGEAFFSWFPSIRDTKRFIGALRFVLVRHSPEGTLEVDPIDLVLIEALRTMHYEVYRRIASGFHSRGDAPSFIWGEDDAKKAFRSQIDSIVESLPNDSAHRKSIQIVLEGLFPQATEHASYYEGTEITWLKERRVCHPKFFHLYFQLALEEGDLCAVTLDQVISSSGDRDKTKEILEAAKAAGNILDLLEGIFAIRERLPAENLAVFITALFDSGDNMPEGADPFLLIDPSMAACRIIHHRLKVESQELGDEVLLQAYTSTTGVYLPVRFYALEDRRTRDKKEAGAEFILSENQLPGIQEEVLRLIRARAEDMSLLDLDRAAAVLYRWRDWAGEDEVQAWTTRVVEDPQRALTLLVRLLTTSYSSPGGKEYWLSGKSVESLVDLDALAQAVGALGSENMDDIEKEAAALIKLTIKRRDEGLPYEEVRLKKD